MVISKDVINDYIAGALGGCAGTIAGHPFDTVKVQIQTQEYGGKYVSLADCFKTVNRQNLAHGFFRGLSGPLLSYGFLNSIFFGCYGWTLKKLDYDDESAQIPNYTAIGIASACGTVPQLVFTCPIEVVKVVLQSQIPHVEGFQKVGKMYKGPIEATRHILRTVGVKGLYRGFPTLVVRDIPANVVYMTSFRWSQFQSACHLPSIPSQIVNFIGGGIAGILSWASILPFDVIKSKLQADPSKVVYKGFLDCVSKVYKSEGPTAFFAGFIPMSLRAFFVNAAILMVYSESLSILSEMKKS